jgi:hypothetical protein
VLVERERVPEGEVVAALARALRVPVAGPELAAPEPDALREIHHDVARRRRLLPVAIELPPEGARVLHVAMADPTDLDAIAELEISTGCRVACLAAPLGALEAAIERAYRGFVTKIMSRDEAPPREDGGRERSRRVPFGADLPVATPAASHHSPEAHGVLGTAPHHRIEDGAPLEVRLQALLDLLQARGILTAEEYAAEVRKLLKGRE